MPQELDGCGDGLQQGGGEAMVAKIAIDSDGGGGLWWQATVFDSISGQQRWWASDGGSGAQWLR